MTVREQPPAFTPWDVVLLAEVLEPEDTLEAYLTRQRRCHHALMEQREERNRELRERLADLPFP